jgi:hypothetical protein
MSERESVEDTALRLNKDLTQYSNALMEKLISDKINPYKIGPMSHEFEDVMENAINQLMASEGTINIWRQLVLEDGPNKNDKMDKIKRIVKKQYKRKFKEIEKLKKGPLQTGPPQGQEGMPGLM